MDHEHEDDDGYEVVLVKHERRVLATLTAQAVAAGTIRAGLEAFMVIGAGLEVAFAVLWRHRRALVVDLLDHRPAGSVLAEIRAVVALIDLEDDDDGRAEGEVSPPLLAVDEHRGHQVVVDEEHEEVESILLPHGEDLTPVEVDARIGAAHGETHHWRHEQQCPQDKIDDRLLPMFFLK